MATALPIDSDLMTGFRQGDEKALERVFRSTFPMLVEEARTQLEDPNAAARMVENTFARAWNERAKFASAEQLQQFLHDTLHVSCVREQRRRAAIQRFETNEGVHGKASAAARPGPDVDTSWEHLTTLIHHKVADEATLKHQVADVSRHAAAHHVAEIGKKPGWVIPVIVGAAAIIVGAILMKVLDKVSAEGAITGALGSNEARVLTSQPGQRAEVNLNDGSKMTMGPETKVRITPDFGENEKMRAVALDGTASFDVVSGKQMPLEIRIGNNEVLAGSNKVDVRNFPAESLAVVRARGGSVTLRADGKDRVVNDGQAVTVSKKGKVNDATPDQVAQGLGWVDGKLAFISLPLKDAITELRRWFQLDLYVKDSSLFKRTVTMSVPLDSSPNVIPALESAANLKFGYEGKTMVLHDAPPAPATPIRPAAKKKP